uniref:Uncharacterized protein n=1 Tax=Ditylenchus dipsaci TaxID=166011 RepID=A0A915DTZ5_9BILA
MLLPTNKNQSDEDTAMFYVQRNAPEWFADDVVENSLNQLKQSDLDMIRVLEDLIDVLTAKGVFKIMTCRRCTGQAAEPRYRAQALSSLNNLIDEDEQGGFCQSPRATPSAAPPPPVPLAQQPPAQRPASLTVARSRCPCSSAVSCMSLLSGASRNCRANASLIHATNSTPSPWAGCSASPRKWVNKSKLPRSSPTAPAAQCSRTVAFNGTLADSEAHVAQAPHQLGAGNARERLGS